MAIEITSFPITFDDPFYLNAFRAFVKEEIEFRQIDFGYDDDCAFSEKPVSSGLVRITVGSDPTTIFSVTDEITIVGGEHQPSVGTVTAITANPGPGTWDIDTDITFISNVVKATDVYIFKNYDNYRLLWRVAEFTTQDDQSATNLFNVDFVYYPSPLGVGKLDISIVSDLLTPDLGDGIDANDQNPNLFVEYQVQYKEVWTGSSNTWITAYDDDLTDFVAFISVHAGGDVAAYEKINYCPDENVDTRIWKGYDKYFSAVISEEGFIDDLILYFYEHEQDGSGLTFTNLYEDVAINGLFQVIIPSNFAWDSGSATPDTRLVRFFVDYFTGSNYHELTLWDTMRSESSNENEYEQEYYLTWISEAGTIRNWLFMHESEFSEKVNTNILQSEEFRQIPSDSEETIKLIAKGLSKKELDYIKSLISSNKINYLNLDSTYECIVKNPSVKWKNLTNNYNFEIEIQKKPKYIMNN